jgi:hypothetical protein
MVVIVVILLQLILGFTKCVTTFMDVKLGYLAPMPVADICIPIHQTVYYSYKNWPGEYNVINGTEGNKIMRDTKCPQLVSKLDEISIYLPQILLILGVHYTPSCSFKAFRMCSLISSTRMGVIMILRITEQLYVILIDFPIYEVLDVGEEEKVIVCIKTKFQIQLFNISKTLLGDVERQFLAPDHEDSGKKLKNHYIKIQSVCMKRVK